MPVSTNCHRALWRQDVTPCPLPSLPWVAWHPGGRHRGAAGSTEVLVPGAMAQICSWVPLTSHK